MLQQKWQRLTEWQVWWNEDKTDTSEETTINKNRVSKMRDESVTGQQRQVKAFFWHCSDLKEKRIKDKEAGEAVSMLLSQGGEKTRLEQNRRTPLQTEMHRRKQSFLIVSHIRYGPDSPSFDGNVGRYQFRIFWSNLQKTTSEKRKNKKKNSI